MPPKLLAVVDTIGAGDSFVAAAIHSLVESRRAGGSKDADACALAAAQFAVDVASTKVCVLGFGVQLERALTEAKLLSSC